MQFIVDGRRIETRRKVNQIQRTAIIKVNLFPANILDIEGWNSLIFNSSCTLSQCSIQLSKPENVSNVSKERLKNFPF